ncbi:MAG: hypothetical protein JSV85_03755 [Candidatus Bathyarchaeota archaeon]|nr:MAG: hypothetical protein JSV85_03755 [Candidatus Bathyarchaeota archaeon]
MNVLQKKGVQASIIGDALEKEKGLYISRYDGSKLDLSSPVEEELWKVRMHED